MLYSPTLDLSLTGFRAADYAYRRITKNFLASFDMSSTVFGIGQQYRTDPQNHP